MNVHFVKVDCADDNQKGFFCLEWVFCIKSFGYF